jgi:hypothetical protein
MISNKYSTKVSYAARKSREIKEFDCSSFAGGRHRNNESQFTFMADCVFGEYSRSPSPPRNIELRFNSGSVLYSNDIYDHLKSKFPENIHFNYELESSPRGLLVRLTGIQDVNQNSSDVPEHIQGLIEEGLEGLRERAEEIQKAVNF